MTDTESYQAVVVGAGFAGITRAKKLAQHGIRVVVIDRNDYHQFQPLLYQVATAQLGVGDIARSLRGISAKDETVSVKTATVVSVDPVTRTVTTADGTRYSGDAPFRTSTGPDEPPNLGGYEKQAKYCDLKRA